MKFAVGRGEEAILIAGAGALGSVIGGMLARAGERVTLLGRKPHLEAIAARGLEIEGLWGEHRVRGIELATDGSELCGPYAAVLVTAKAYDTATVGRLVAPHLGPDSVVISVQNGLGNVEALEAAVGKGRVIGGRVIFGAEVVSVGRVRVTVYADPLLLGAPDPCARPELQAAAARWAERLDRAGVPAEPTERIAAALWGKVLYNAPLNPLGALLGCRYGELAADPDARMLMDGIIEEAFTVAHAEGIELPWADAAAYRETFYGRLVPVTADHRSSMLQDLERGRPTEVDAINGAVWARGRRRNIAAPLNAAMTRLMHVRARRARRQG